MLDLGLWRSKYQMGGGGHCHFQVGDTGPRPHETREAMGRLMEDLRDPLWDVRLKPTSWIECSGQEWAQELDVKPRVFGRVIF